MKPGDLIEFADGIKAIATTGTYVHRKIDREDEEMIAAGMGHLAGTYCNAFKVIIPETGKTKIVIFGETQFNLISGGS